jgi:hypothetical protein
MQPATLHLVGLLMFLNPFIPGLPVYVTAGLRTLESS